MTFDVINIAYSHLQIPQMRGATVWALQVVEIARATSVMTRCRFMLRKLEKKRQMFIHPSDVRKYETLSFVLYGATSFHRISTGLMIASAV